VAARDTDTPPYSYPVAVAAGLFCTWSSVLLGRHLSVLFEPWQRDLGFVGLTTVAAGHLVLGGVFGMMWPEKTWRWGVWLCLVPVGLVSLLEPDVSLFFRVVALTLAPACAGAYAAARVHLKYVAVNESG
jgi:hypothetical protein